MKDKFTYSYSAKQQEEIRRIREKYVSREPDKMEQLRRLDQSVTRKGTTVALSVGILSTLVLGVGMCCTLVWADTLFVPGIVIGIVGLVGVSLTYPLYLSITKKERARLAPEILRLTDELSQQ